jgi:methionyl-tRNA formyltransferase
VPKKVCILTSRDVGRKCVEWATSNTPTGFLLTNDINSADIVISVMYENIIKKKQIENKVCFNFHPGTLPEYRGSGVFSWAIINQERKMGITLHLIDEGMDTGDIIEIRQFLISRQDTAHSLFLRGEQVILKMFKDWYTDLLNDNYTACPQNPKEGKNYYIKDLQRAKNLTKFVKAFHFPEKEPAYFYNDKMEKTYIYYTKELQSEKY